MSEKLRQAAQAAIDCWNSPNWDRIHTGELIFALREALREDAPDGFERALREALREDALAEMQALTESKYRENAEVESDEFERIGSIFGIYGGRFVFTPDHLSAVWPNFTVVYVRRVKK
jgi:hypothetical protein